MMFHRCMYSVCKVKGGGILQENKCKLNAKAAYLMVMGLGCPLFKKSQREACVCTDKSEL